MFVVLIGVAVSTSSCEDDYFVTIDGKAIADQSTIRNGSFITLTIGNISQVAYALPEGKNPVVHYLIDGKEVAASKDGSSPFKATYKVEGLSIGKHTLSANITCSEKGAVITNNISSSEITVLDE